MPNAILLLASLQYYYTHISGTITGLMHAYGYAAIFFLMLLESSSVPIPSEVIMPAAGLFAANGTISFYAALAVSILGSAVGIAIDYLVGYYIGKDLIYKHLHFFRISRESLDAFDLWFEKNGIAAVFITRLLPVVRTLMSFPAGFAKMPPRTFFSYSIAGAAVWNATLMLFGFFFLSGTSAEETLVAIGIFGLALYALYSFALKRMKKRQG